MNIDFQEILKELEFRVPTGIIDLNEESQVTTLVQILSEYGVSDPNEIAQKARVYFSYVNEAKKKMGAKPKKKAAPQKPKSLPSGETLVVNKKTGNVYPVKNFNSSKHTKASEEDIAKAKASGKLGKQEPKSTAKPKKQEPKQSTIDISAAEKRKRQTGNDDKAKKRTTPSEPEVKSAPKVIGKIDDSVMREVEDEYVRQESGETADMRDIKPDYSKKPMAEGYSDKDYYSKSNNGRGHSTLVRQEPFLFDKKTHEELQKGGFPEEYIQFLERCINTEVDGKQPPVTELIKQGGAGQIQSQFGEVMAMAFMSIRDPKRREQLANLIKQQIQETKADLLKQKIGKKAFNELKKDPKKYNAALDSTTTIADESWVDASLSHGESFDAAMDELYGKGKWRFEGAAWDKRDDIESLGLDYKNKGFSTDVMLRVQPLDKSGKPKGKPQAQRCSLKKDEKIMFFNGSVNEVENFLLNYVTEKERVRARALESLWSKAQDGNKNKEEKLAAREKIMKLTGTQKWTDGADIIKDEAQKIRDASFEKAPKEVQDAVTSIREFAGKQTKSALKLGYYASVDMKPKELEDAANQTFKTAADKKFAINSHKIIKECAAKNGEVTEECVSAGLAKINPKKSGTKYVCKACVAAARVAKSAGYDVDAKLEEHYKIAEDAGNALIKAIPKSKELLAGVMQKLAEAFPLKVCMDGTEFMLIDGVHITAKTLKSVFGVENYNDLNKGLTVVEVNGEAMLVFSAGSGKKQIPIGYVDARQKGKGSEGTIGFEILCNDEFVQKCSSANISNGDTSTANKKAYERISKSIANREKKKKETNLDNETEDEE